MAMGRQAVAGALPRMHQAVTRLIPGKTLLVSPTIDAAKPVSSIIVQGLRRCRIAMVAHALDQVDAVIAVIDMLHITIQLRQAAVRVQHGPARQLVAEAPGI